MTEAATPEARTEARGVLASIRQRWPRNLPVVFPALLTLVIVLGLLSPRSVEPGNLINLARQGAPLGLVATGQTVVMISGGLDLSVGSTVILADVMAAMWIADREANVIPVVLLILFIGAIIGLANGLLVTRFRVTPFIATLGMNFIVYGAALIVSGGAPRGSIPPSLRFWGNGFIGGVIPAAAVVWLVFSLVAAFLLRRSTLGRRLMAVGANPRAAHLAGVQVPRVTVLSYVVGSVMAAAGGVMLVAYVGVGTLEVGTDFLLLSIAASVIGGTPFEGGRGTVSGTVGGVLFLMVLESILTVLTQVFSALLPQPISGRWIMRGLIILIALILHARNRE
jgi:ribose/xylose/arabinose/galactoside ABC-type transport system permease subunit